MKSIEEARIETAQEILDESEARDPVKTYCLFSGGHDSLVATHVAHELSDPDGVVHINTGIGIPETRTFVRDTCEAQDWNLIEKETEHEYEDLVLEHGFPGPQAHRYAYTTLKERAIDALLREAKESREQEVVFLTGVRRSESRNRMGSADVINKRGSQVWAAPIIYWDALDVTRWIRDHDIERSPVVDKLHMSGECLCGAFATRGEFEQIEMFYPEVAERIERLEDEARNKDMERCRWGWANRRQGGESDDATDYFMPLCKDCEAADDAEQ